MRVHFAELAEAGLIDPATFAELLVNVLDWTTMAFEAGLHTNLIHPKVDCAEGADVAVGQLPVELPNQREGRSD
jgi:phosphoribulokinase